MKQFQINYENKSQLCVKLSEIKDSFGEIPDSRILFYITWSAENPQMLLEITELLEVEFPGSDYYGNEASGSISKGDFTNAIHITCYVFEIGDTETELVWVEEGTSVASLKELWDYCKTKKELRGIELIPSLSYVEQLKIDGSVPDVSDDVLIFGGAACNPDVNPIKAEIMAKGHPVTSVGMAVILYSGSSLSFSANSVLGWKGLGRRMEVTESDDKRIIEINNKSAYSIYEKYLNLSVEDTDTLVFPLIVEEDGNEFIRTPHSINPDKSMIMFASIPKGTMVRIAYGDKNTILDDINGKAREISELCPEIIKAYSCAGRRLFWGDGEVGCETRIFEEIAPVSGFYTGGEILRFGKKLKVMNQTLAIVTISETGKAGKRNAVKLQSGTKDKSLVSRLAYFTQMVSEEQEKANLQLEENMQMIKGLAEEYFSLFYVNIDDGTFKVYSINPAHASNARKLMNGMENGNEILREFGKSEFVHPADRYLFDAVDNDMIRARLANSKKFSIRFRERFGEEYLWTEMDVIKYEGINERANSIAIGFAERDAEIRSEQALNICLGVLCKEIAPEKAINELLSTAGEFYAADRCYIFEFVDNKEYSSETFEWCAEGKASVISEYQRMPAEVFDGLTEIFRRDGSYIFDISELKDEAEGENYVKGCLSWKKGMECMMAVPILNGEEVVGFIGLDNPTKAKNNITVLKNFASVIYGEILKRNENDEEHVTLEKLTDTFISVYYVDLTRDYMHPWKQDKDFERLYGDVENYSVAMEKYVHNCIAAEERAQCMIMTDLKYILSQFRLMDHFSINMTDIMLDEERDVVFDYVKINEEGNQFVICRRDVTDSLEKEREQQRQLKDALDAADVANKSKTNFLFNMSHDIRTPMNAITGFTNMAIKHIDEKEKVLDCLSKIQKSGNMLLSLINSVLEVSRIESGKAVLEEQRGDVYFSFINIETTMYELAQAKKINLSFSFNNIMDRYVYCDFGRCMRVFVNVISNAIKYTAEGGEVKVCCEQLGRAEQDYGIYRYTVTDNGIGMSDEFQKHVFEQFSREKTATVSGIQGTGLGMAVCKTFVELMGGKIECSSKKDVGTTFTITLPFKLQKEQSSSEQAKEEDHGLQAIEGREGEICLKGRKILLVEDNEMNREIAADMLEEEGIIVEMAEDGTGAVDLLKRKGPEYYDFVLMDIQMPVMGGYEATRTIRKMYPEAGLPIIALSANAFAEDKIASIEAGMNEHVAKPINKKELFMVIDNIINLQNGLKLAEKGN